MDPDAPPAPPMEMTVGDLIAVLSELPPETLVVMPRDDRFEGNSFAPLCEVEPCVYVPDQWNDGSFSIDGTIFGEEEVDEANGGISVLELPGAAKAICLRPGD